LLCKVIITCLHVLLRNVITAFNIADLMCSRSVLEEKVVPQSHTAGMTADTPVAAIVGGKPNVTEMSMALRTATIVST